MIAQNIKTIPHSAEEEQLQSIGKTLNMPDGFDFSIRRYSRFSLTHVLPLEKKGMHEDVLVSSVSSTSVTRSESARGAIQTKPFIHDVNQQDEHAQRRATNYMGPPEPFRHRNSQINFGRWWRQTGSNRRPEACKATALPTELCPQLAIVPGEAGFPASQTMVGLGRVELPTSRLSSARSNQLSYRP
jgi:hypothetical protein